MSPIELYSLCLIGLLMCVGHLCTDGSERLASDLNSSGAQAPAKHALKIKSDRSSATVSKDELYARGEMSWRDEMENSSNGSMISSMVKSKINAPDKLEMRWQVNIDSDVVSKLENKRPMSIGIDDIKNVQCEEIDGIKIMGNNNTKIEGVSAQFMLTVKNCIADIHEIYIGTLYDGIYEYIKDARHLRSLKINATHLSFSEIIEFVRQNEGLSTLTIDRVLYGDEEFVRAHDSIFNIRKFEQIYIASVSQYFHLLAHKKIIKSSNTDIFEAYNNYNLLHLAHVTTDEKMAAAIVALDKIKHRFEMIHVTDHFGDSGTLRNLMEWTDVPVMKVSVLPYRNIEDSFLRIGHHYDVNLYDATFLSSIIMKAHSLRIFWKVQNNENYNMYVLQILYAKRLGSLNIVSKRISDDVDDKYTEDAKLVAQVSESNTLLKELRQRLNPQEHLKELITLETDLFQSNEFDLYVPFLELTKLKTLVVRFEISQRLIAENLLKYLRSLDMHAWAFSMDNQIQKLIAMKINQNEDLMPDQMFNLKTKWILNLEEGTFLNKTTDEYVLISAIDGFLSKNDALASVKIICPSNYMPIRLNRLTRKVIDHIQKRIVKDIKALVLTHVTDDTLDLLGINKDASVDIERIQIHDGSHITRKIGNNMPKLTQLFCSPKEFPLFQTNKKIGQLFANATNCKTSAFTPLTEFIQRNKQLNQFAVKFGNESFEGVSSIETIASRLFAIRKFDKYLKMENISAKEVFIYSKEEDSLQISDVRMISLCPNKYAKLRLTNLKADNLEPFFGAINKKGAELSSLFVKGKLKDMEPMLENASISGSLEKISICEIHVDNGRDRHGRHLIDKIVIDRDTKSTKLHVYSNSLLKYIPDNTCSIEINHHNKNIASAATLVTEILKLRDSEVISVNTDNQFFRTLTSRIDLSTHFPKLVTLNLCKDVSFENYNILELPTLKYVNIWNDESNESLHGSFCRIAGNHYTVNARNIDFLRGIPSHVRALNIFLDVGPQLLSVEPEGMPTFELNNIEKLNISNEWNRIGIADIDATQSKIPLKFNNALLIMYSIQFKSMDQFQNLREIVTDLFDDDYLDIYNAFFEMPVLESVVIYFTPNQKNMATNLKQYLYSNDLPWEWEMEKNRIIGKKVQFMNDDMRHNHKSLATDYTLDLFNGFLHDSNGEYIFDAVIDELFSPCSGVTRIKVICAADYSDIRLNSLTEKVTSHLRECNAIEVLVLEYGTDAALKLIGLTESGTNIEGLQLNSHKIARHDENRQSADIGRNVSSLLQLICSTDELSLFSSNTRVQQLFVKTDVLNEAEFDAIKEFLKQNTGLNQFSLTYNTNTIELSSNMRPIVANLHGIRTFEYFKIQDITRESIFGYDKGRKLLQTADVNLFKIYEDYTVLRVTNIRSRAIIPQLLDTILEQRSKLESFSISANAILMNILIDQYDFEYSKIITVIPNVIIQSGKDKIVINNETKSTKIFAYSIFACSHITDDVRLLEIYFYRNKNYDLAARISQRILELGGLINLSIGRDNGLMANILQYFNVTDLQYLSKLNLCKEASLAIGNRCDILALDRLREVSIWNDIPGAITLNEVVRILQDAIFIYNGRMPQKRMPAWNFKIEEKNPSLISGHRHGNRRRSTSSAVTLQ